MWGAQIKKSNAQVRKALDYLKAGNIPCLHCGKRLGQHLVSGDKCYDINNSTRYTPMKKKKGAK